MGAPYICDISRLRVKVASSVSVVEQKYNNCEWFIRKGEEESKFKIFCGSAKHFLERCKLKNKQRFARRRRPPNPKRGFYIWYEITVNWKRYSNGLVFAEMSSNKCLEALCVGIRTISPKYKAPARRCMSPPVSHLPYFHKMATQSVSLTRYVENSFCEAEVNEWMLDRTVVAVDGPDRNKKIGRFSLRRSQLEITRLHSSSSSSFLTESIRFSV